jgi:hypothetical protein
MEHPKRHCNGGPTQRSACGKPATVVCTARDDRQWYACDDRDHQENALTEPIEAWFKRIFEVNSKSVTP